MAMVTDVIPDDRNASKIHPTRVEVRYIFVEIDGRKFVQLNTYGSQDRMMPEKLSQTLQFDRANARKLWELIGREFDF